MSYSNKIYKEGNISPNLKSGVQNLNKIYKKSNIQNSPYTGLQNSIETKIESGILEFPSRGIKSSSKINTEIPYNSNKGENNISGPWRSQIITGIV